MNSKISEVQKRTRQYWFVDGLAELAAGLASLFLALLFWAWQSIFTWRWSLPVILGSGLAVSFGLRLIIQQIKERSTYPRTGYASPFTGLESKRSVVTAVAFALLLLAANYYLSSSGSQALSWSPALAGLVFAFVFGWTGVLVQLPRFYFLALLSGCTGLAVSLLGADYFRGVAVLCGVVGLVLAAQGTWVHAAYVRQNPAGDE